MKKLLLLNVLILLSTSCSSKLSNEEASVVIKELFPRHCSTHKMITHAYFYPNTRYEAKDREALKAFRNLEDQGLVTVKLSETGFVSNPNKDYYIEPTERSMNTYGKGFPITRIDLSEVIAISQTEKEAIVRYTVKNTKTPYHRLHDLRNQYGRNKKVECAGAEWEEEVTLIKFDDGWRIKKK